MPPKDIISSECPTGFDMSAIQALMIEYNKSRISQWREWGPFGPEFYFANVHVFYQTYLSEDQEWDDFIVDHWWELMRTIKPYLETIPEFRYIEGANVYMSRNENVSE